MEIYRWLRHQWDRTTAVLLALAGLLALLFGWLGVSRVTLPGEQIPYVVSGAVLGLFALGAAATLWVSADLRDLWRKFDDMHHDLIEAKGAPSIELSSGPSSDPIEAEERNTRARGPVPLSAAARLGERV